MGVELALLALMAAGGLRVETSTPAALCPDIGEVRRAVSERLGQIEANGEWLASYDLVHRPGDQSGDVVRLHLRDPQGRVRLRRDLPRAGESCVAVAQAMVLVLESYFRHPTERDATEPANADAGTLAAEAAPASSPAWHGPALDVRGGWAAGPSSPTLMLDAWLATRSGWAFGCEGSWLTTEQRRAVDYGGGVGTGSFRSAAVRGWLARRFRTATTVDVLLGPEVVVAFDRATVSDVPGGMSNVRAAPGAGLRGQVRLRLAAHVALSLVAAADLTPRAWAGQFEVEGTGREVFPASGARFLVGVGLSVTLLR
jgi:hypothetical protein